MFSETETTFSEVQCVFRCRSSDLSHVLQGLVEAYTGEEAALLVGDIPRLLDEDHDAAHHSGDQGPHCHKPEICRGSKPAERGQTCGNYQHPLARADKIEIYKRPTTFSLFVEP